MVPDEKPRPESASLSVALCIGGAAVARFERILRHLAVGLVDQAVQAQFVSSEPRCASLTLGPVRSLVHAPIRAPFGRFRLRELIARLSSNPPGIIHAISGESYQTAAALAEGLDADLVVQITGLADFEMVDRLERSAVGRWTAWSDPLSRELIRRWGIVGDAVRVIRPGVFAGLRPACFSDAERLPTLLCTSPLRRDYGIEVLLDALGHLRLNEREFQAFLLGEGPAESTFRRQVRQRRLDSVVTFVHPMGDIAAAMQSADLFLCPSPDNDFAADALAAMGAGMAVVALSPLASDHLIDGRTAVICRMPTAEGLAEGIESLLLNPVRAKSLAASAQEYVRGRHAASAMAEQTADVYRGLSLARATFSMS